MPTSVSNLRDYTPKPKPPMAAKVQHAAEIIAIPVAHVEPRSDCYEVQLPCDCGCAER